jgi:acetyltransferase-like isoleucine patch superfamily enzyme
MKQLIRICIVEPLRLLGKGFLRCYHELLFRVNQVNYNDFPVINGRMLISNKGKLSIGSKVTFNNSTKYNFVGVYKPCSLFVEKDAVLTIGANSGFSGISIYCTSRIDIGSYVNIGGNVCIWDTDFHPLDHLERRVNNKAKIQSRPVTIADDVFIGANSIILKGANIGERSVIGAGSVVTKNIPPDEIWAGNPARFIRKITTTVR